MSTSPIPEVQVLEHLLIHGPSKVTVLKTAANLSETSTRKLMDRLCRESKVIKDGPFFKLNEQTNSGSNLGEARRAAVTDRDQQVRALFGELAADETASRDKVASMLKMPGSLAYLSIYRLHKQGVLERVHVGKRAPEWRCVRHSD